MKRIATIPACYCAPGAPTMAPAEAESLAARFKALSDPTRVALINRLAGATRSACATSSTSSS